MIFKPKANEVSIDPSKSIAIVGNASSLLNHSFGQEIDSYDVIIRLNKGFIGNPESQGTRTDILGLSCKLTKKEFISNFNCKKVIWLTPKRKNTPRYLRYSNEFSYYPLECWHQLYQELNYHRPSSGIMMIDYIIRHLGCKGVKLFGFDQKKTKTFYLEDDHKGPHAWVLEKDLIQQILNEYIPESN